jgi:hypothetical protein
MRCSQRQAVLSIGIHASAAPMVGLDTSRPKGGSFQRFPNSTAAPVQEVVVRHRRWPF